MSNDAILVAENTRIPVGPWDEPNDPKAKTVFVAGAVYQIPAFWLFCFEEPELVDREYEGEPIPTLVTALKKARQRLKARDPQARELFPAHARIWEGWRQAIDSVERRYLKVDAFEIWQLSPGEGELGGEICLALDWFESDKESELSGTQLAYLLRLAGITKYDPKKRSFPIPKGECAEKFLIGYEIDVPLPSAVKLGNVDKLVGSCCPLASPLFGPASFPLPCVCKTRKRNAIHLPLGPARLPPHALAPSAAPGRPLAAQAVRHLQTVGLHQSSIGQDAVRRPVRDQLPAVQQQHPGTGRAHHLQVVRGDHLRPR